MTAASPRSPTSAVLVIGNEILSGRTQDTHIADIAKFLGPLGIELCEARVVRDVEAEIVAAINALRANYTYVFTTGGIGPTHDDITADAMARAFGVGIDYHPEALAILERRYNPGEFNVMRRRMARIPDGATLIRNPVSGAPGFQLENVFVMAGVPMIMRAMLEDIAPRLSRSEALLSRTVKSEVPEGRIAQPLAQVQATHPQVAIGSYPFYRADGSGVEIVISGREAAAVEAAIQAVEAILSALGASSERI